MAPEMVSVPAVTPMAASAARVTDPLSVFEPETFTIAPLPPTPVPLTVRGSAELTPPARARVAPYATVVPPAVVPSPASFSTRSVPAFTDVVPV